MSKVRLEYPTRKVEALTKLEELASRSSVISLAKLSKVRASQLMSLRKKLSGQVHFVVVKNTLAKKALKKLKGSEDFLKLLEGQNLFIFTDMNPFKLSLLLEKNKVYLPARAGDVATDPIIVPAGNTGLPPGPVLSEFKECGVPTRIDSGSIWVAKDTVVRQRGEVISLKLASLLAKLGIKPIRAGISLYAAYVDGIILREEDLKLDLEEYSKQISELHAQALALAVEVGYSCKESLSLLIIRAAQQGVAVAISASYPADKSTTEKIVSEAYLKASALLRELSGRGYS
ncbi:MAG: 50S ribosomal protein L10 [Nitrososphaerales archaeon]